MFKRIITVLLSILMFSTFATSTICANETNDKFETMLNNLFTTNSRKIKANKEGMDITEEFIETYRDVYIDYGVEAIIDVVSEKNIYFSERNNLCDISPRAIFSKTYTSDLIYSVATGTSPVNPSVTIKLPILWYFRVTVNYDYNTGKISGGLRTPTIIIDSTDGLTDTVNVYDVSFSGGVTNGGYSVTYNSVSFVPEAYADDGTGWGIWQEYNRVTWYGPVTYTPAE